MTDNPRYGCGAALLLALAFWAIAALVVWLVLR